MNDSFAVPGQRRRVPLGLSVVAAAMFLGSVYAWLDGGLPVVVRTALGHPFWFGLAAVILVAATLASVAEPRGDRVAVVIVALLVSAIWGVACWFVDSILLGNYDLAERHPAPAEAPLEVRIEQGSAMIDPLWRFSVRRWAGLRTRDWPAGCLNGDDPINAFSSIEWLDADTFVVETEDARQFAVNLDPRTGQPDTEFSVGC